MSIKYSLAARRAHTLKPYALPSILAIWMFS